MSEADVEKDFNDFQAHINWKKTQTEAKKFTRSALQFDFQPRSQSALQNYLWLQDSKWSTKEKIIKIYKPGVQREPVALEFKTKTTSNA